METGADDAGSTRFVEVDYPEPHRERARRILREHPEVRALFGRNPWTALVVALVVAAQFALAVLVRDAPLWVVVAVAWLAGAILSHFLFTAIHECAHNLIFRPRWANQAVGLLANAPLVVPSAESFRIYHLKHHQYQGDPQLDPDLASAWEARIFGRSFLGKLVWQTGFPVFQTLRLRRFSRSGRVAFVTPGVVVNVLVLVAVDAAVVTLFGPTALLYLAVSLVASVGPHPVGARWVQEHFLRPGDRQETSSYYGSLNALALNVGYHNEHHDFPFVAWHRLPRLKAAAPEMYDTLKSYRSWTALWLRFLFDRRVTLYSRVVRDGRINKTRSLLPKEAYASETFDETEVGALA